jgi:DNA-binding CsgD family transcriptional regulator
MKDTVFVVWEPKKNSANPPSLAGSRSKYPLFDSSGTIRHLTWRPATPLPIPMTTSDDALNTRITHTTIAAFCTIFTLVVLDLAWDYAKGIPWLHVGTELAVLLIAAIAAGLLVRQMVRERVAIGQLKADLVVAREESQHWRRQSRELVAGLGAAIKAKFEEWRLTDAECEVGLLLLKGLSLREIAELRETSERTVREQARSVYRKAGISGRASLSAYFLEDLLLPH